MVLTSGDGVIYNVTRARMLAGTFRWADPDKGASIIDTTYTFNETHKTLHDIYLSILAAGGHVGGAVLPGLFISANAWAGSAAPQFSGEVWTRAIGSVVITRFLGSSTQVGDDTKYELVACLTTFLGGPIYPDGSVFNIAYDQSNGQQGWFRP